MIFEFADEQGNKIEKVFPIGKCPSFVKKKGIKYTRIFSIPSIIMDADKPKTIGSLAEKNTERMLKEGKITHKKKKNPWWRPNQNKVDLSLANLKGEKLKKYVEKGTK